MRLEHLLSGEAVLLELRVTNYELRVLMTLIQVILYDMIPVWFVCTTGSCLLKYKEIR